MKNIIPFYFENMTPTTFFYPIAKRLTIMTMSIMIWHTSFFY